MTRDNAFEAGRWPRPWVVIKTLAIFAVAIVPVAIASDPMSVTISIAWLDSTAESVEREVAIPLEARLRVLPRVTQIRSTSADGRAELKIIYPSEPSCAEVESIARVLTNARSSLPAGISTPTIASGGAKCAQLGR